MTRVNCFHLEQQGIAAELLSPHRVSTSGHTDSPPFAPAVLQSRLNRVDGRRLDNLVYARGVQLGLHIVDLDPCRLAERTIAGMGR